MTIFYNIKIYTFIILFCLINIPLGQSNSVYSPPISKQIGSICPVEKGKPPVEKTKKKKKKKKRRAFIKKHFNKKKSPKKITAESNAIIELAFGIIGLLFAILIIIGAFIFGFGIYAAAAWITGIVLIGIGNLLDLLIVIFLFANGVDGPYATFFLWMVLLINFIIGLTFLLWGILAAGPLAWIMGIILLGLALVFLAIFIFSRVG